MSIRSALAVLPAVALCASFGCSAFAATLSLSVDSEAIHANMPFTLALSAKGFEEEPVPEPPDLAIEGCEVTYLGVSPNVSSRIEIINGRRSDWREVEFVYRWRVRAPTAGRYTVPALRLEQSGTEARSVPVAFDAADVPLTRDMRVRLKLPERPLWVGETFPVEVEWLLSRDVGDHQFAIPLFDLDGVEVEPGPLAPGGRSIAFDAGARQVELPLSKTTVQEAGGDYTRFGFDARVTLARAGVVDLPPVTVVAQLRSGTVRDSWGFRRARYELFRAEGEPRRLTVRPLPVAGRPPTFVNAIGSGYVLDLQASRTVVSLGEPVDLSIRLRGDGSLTGVSLPPLGGPGGLPDSHFTVPDGSIAGEVDEETNSKLFTVTVRVKSAEVREIPPVAFSYFDPTVGEYRTVTSQPVALSVGAGNTVGVADVVAAPSVAARGAIDDRSDAGGSIATLVGADMSLSAPAATLATPWGTGDARVLLGTLYGVPLIVALLALWVVRTGGSRARGRTVRQTLRALERTLDTRAPARQAAPAIIAAMRRLAEVSGNDPDETGALLQTLEMRAFNPAATGEAVPRETAEELRRVARGWARGSATTATAEHGAVLAKAPAAALSLAVLALLIGSADQAAADETMPDALREARDRYAAAIEETDRLRRVRLFAGAERTYRPIAMANPDSPALQVDWANAALGAQDTGRAVLGYRRALHAAPGDERAQANIAWLRDRLPIWLPRPADDGALDSLLFWRDRLAKGQLHLVGAAGFALGVLLLTPWRRRPKWLGVVSVPAFLVWVTAVGSALAVEDATHEAVVVADGTTLRSADSAGASPTFANPLPAGTEVAVAETRDSWIRVALADGTRGWLAANAVERVVVSPE